MHAIEFLSALHYPVLGFLVVASVLAARSFRARRLYAIAAGWASNLVYMLWRQLATVDFGVVPSGDYLQAAFRSNVINAVSVTLSVGASLAFLYAVRGPPSPRALRLRTRPALWAGFLLALFALAALGGSAGGGPAALKSAGVIASALLTALALISLGRYYQRLHDDVVATGSAPVLLASGAYLYALVQGLYVMHVLLVASPSATNRELLDAFGLVVGFIAKTTIASGYIQLFVIAARRAEGDRVRVEGAQSLIGRINHELGTPLAEVILLTASVRERVARGERIHEPLGSLENAVHRIAAILEAARDVALFNPTQTGAHAVAVVDATRLQPVVSNVNALVQRAVFAVKLTRRERVKWSIRYSGNCFIECVPSEFVQVVVNVLRNACDALPNGTGTVLVRTVNVRPDVDDAEADAQRLADELVQVIIRDDGEGIAPERQSAVFEEGVTSRRGPGRGFGLAVVRDLVTRAGGQVCITSPVRTDLQDRPGTEVLLTFPRVTQRHGESANGYDARRPATAGSLR